VEYGSDDFNEAGFSKDVSDRGLFIIARKLIDVGARIHLRISSPLPFYAEGIVVRHHMVPNGLDTYDKPGMGIRLCLLSDVLRVSQLPEASEDAPPVSQTPPSPRGSNVPTPIPMIDAKMAAVNNLLRRQRSQRPPPASSSIAPPELDESLLGGPRDERGMPGRAQIGRAQALRALVQRPMSGETQGPVADPVKRQVGNRIEIVCASREQLERLIARELFAGVVVVPTGQRTLIEGDSVSVEISVTFGSPYRHEVSCVIGKMVEHVFGRDAHGIELRFNNPQRLCTKLSALIEP